MVALNRQFEFAADAWKSSKVFLSVDLAGHCGPSVFLHDGPFLPTSREQKTALTLLPVSG